MKPLQGGSSALPMVLLILMMGGVLLTLSQQQLERGMALAWDEGQYQQAWQDAESVLNWGLTQSWTEKNSIDCRTLADIQGQVCLLPQKDRRLLLRAEGGAACYRLTHWRWVTRRQTRLIPLNHGWIDFCPLNERAACEVTDGK
ncbi:DUF2509 family protein [Enterobacteriaceae bacterium LUAb1]